jgi:hypothetical protein
MSKQVGDIHIQARAPKDTDGTLNSYEEGNFRQPQQDNLERVHQMNVQ